MTAFVTAASATFWIWAFIGAMAALALALLWACEPRESDREVAPREITPGMLRARAELSTDTRAHIAAKRPEVGRFDQAKRAASPASQRTAAEWFPTGGAA